jgi:hypothetical protein
LRACVSVKRHIALATLVIRNVEKSVHVRLKERAASHAQGLHMLFEPLVVGERVLGLTGGHCRDKGVESSKRRQIKGVLHRLAERREAFPKKGADAQRQQPEDELTLLLAGKVEGGKCLDGYLIVTESNETDLSRIEDDPIEFCRSFRVLSVAYDLWAATQSDQRSSQKKRTLAE